MKINKYSKKIYILFLTIFSFYINFYYGHLGVYPLDTFLFYDSSLRILEGATPFKDFWISTGLTIDIMQALIFKLFGISFKNYVLHASLMNVALTLATFFIFIEFKLSNFFSFFYSLILSITAYPVSGTPFLDHHSIIFCIFAVYCFLLALKQKKNIFWFLIPFFLVLAFFSKQTPSGYLIITMALLTLIYFYFNFSKRFFLIVSFSSFLSLTLIFILLLIYDLGFLELYNQYFSYPSYLGEIRMNSEGFLMPLDFSRYFLKFKFIHLSYFFLLFCLSKLILTNNIFKNENFYILVLLIIFPLILIFHQLMSLNQKFVDFISPILFGFSHIYLINYKHLVIKKFIFFKSFILIFSLIFVFDIFFNYVDNRRFMDLKKINLNKTINGAQIDKSLDGLKWLTYLYPNEPIKEIEMINKTIVFLKNQKQNFILITHYSFMHNLIGKKSLNTARVHDDVSIPLKNDKNFSDYKDNFIELIINKNVSKIYIISPLNFKSIDGIISENCLTMNQINKILLEFNIIENCT